MTATAGVFRSRRRKRSRQQAVPFVGQNDNTTNSDGIVGQDRLNPKDSSSLLEFQEYTKTARQMTNTKRRPFQAVGTTERLNQRQQCWARPVLDQPLPWTDRLIHRELYGGGRRGKQFLSTVSNKAKADLSRYRHRFVPFSKLGTPPNEAVVGLESTGSFFVSLQATEPVDQNDTTSDYNGSRGMDNGRSIVLRIYGTTIRLCIFPPRRNETLIGTKMDFPSFLQRQLATIVAHTHARAPCCYCCYCPLL